MQMEEEEGEEERQGDPGEVVGLVNWHSLGGAQEDPTGTLIYAWILSHLGHVHPSKCQCCPWSTQDDAMWRSL